MPTFQLSLVKEGINHIANILSVSKCSPYGALYIVWKLLIRYVLHLVFDNTNSFTWGAVVVKTSASHPWNPGYEPYQGHDTVSLYDTRSGLQNESHKLMSSFIIELKFIMYKLNVCRFDLYGTQLVHQIAPFGKRNLILCDICSKVHLLWVSSYRLIFIYKGNVIRRRESWWHEIMP